MGTAPVVVADQLRATLGLSRVVETGTFQGEGTSKFSAIFPSVVTIELNEEFWRNAKSRLSALHNVEFVLGDCGTVLPAWITPETPSLYFLDGHWCDGTTAGGADQCPVLNEIAALGKGHPSDCIVIDDARFFLWSPPPPYNPDDWPTIVQVIDALRAIHPGHHITVLADQVFAVPKEARAVVDEYGRGLDRSAWRSQARRVLGDRLPPWSPVRLALRRLKSEARRRVARASS